jgi:diguanylate cyclase (GGDEF)-like protein
MAYIMAAAVENKPQILVIDDEEQIRRLLITVLSERYDCFEAESAEQALKALKQNHFDLIISDIQMSGMSGLDLLSHLHAVAPDCLAVMISGQSSIESAIAAMRAGAFDYIPKPLDIRYVEAAIERALKQSFLLIEQRRYEVKLEELLWQRTAEINQLAYYDTLTELPNRTLFEDRVTQAVAVAKRADLTLVLLFVSLDQLKKVRDTLGRLTGDRLLKEASTRLRGCAGESTTVARFDNGFALLLSTIGQTNDVLELIEAIREVLKSPFDLDGHEILVTASVGISLFPLDGEDCESLVKNAGAALYRARISGGNTYQFYTADMHAVASKRLQLETSLRHAIENDKLILHYQRRLTVDSLEITGVEALVRWQHPHLGLVPPADFIPLAEETGLILPLGEWVLRAACRQNREWQDKGFAPMRIGVNISARQLQEQSLAGTVAQILHETALSPEFLELELTESSIMSNAEAAIDVLTRLKTMGVTISIDDFGTGFSSLSYLKRLPIDALKIDQSFVRDVTTDPDDAALVMAIISLAHNLRLRVVAEGVETEEQLRFLHLLRCDEIQGYIFKEPLPADALEPLLVRHPNELLARTALSA